MLSKLPFRLEAAYCTVLYEVLLNVVSVVKIMQYQGQTCKWVWSTGELTVRGGKLRYSAENLS
jgi:hypothetical protein